MDENNLNLEEGSTQDGMRVDNPALGELATMVQTLFESGEEPLNIIVDLLSQGLEKEQLTLAFEQIGFDPASFTQLLQDAEITISRRQQKEEMQSQQEVESQNVEQDQEQDYQPEMQYGGPTNKADGFLDNIKGQTPRAVYMPVVPEQANYLNAAFMLSDMGGVFGSKNDLNKDGLQDGTFRDWAAKQDLYKKKLNESYKYGGDLPKAQNLGQFTPTDIPKYAMNSTLFDDIDYFGDSNNNKRINWNNVQSTITPPTDTNIGSAIPPQVGIPKYAMNSMLFDELDYAGNSIDNPNDMSTPMSTTSSKRSLGDFVGNAYNKAETFIESNPTVQAFGDVSQAAVVGANLANQFFKNRDFNNFKNEVRNSTTADKVYGALSNLPNKRGTWDANLGLAEPDNLVDNYGYAMYGKETYKSGGQFEPHMMYDPSTKEGYNANQKEDHLRMAEMGYLHQDEMYQEGGSTKDNAVQEYNDFYNYLKTMRQAVGTQDKAALKEDSFNGKPYTTNTLARDYNKAQQLRKAAGLGLYEDMALTLPQVGQQMRGTVNSWLGTSYQEGGEIEVDNDTLAALIAAGADLEIL